MKKIISVLTIITIFLLHMAYAASGEEGKTYQDGYNAGYNAGYSDGSDNVYKPKEPNVVLIEQQKIAEIKAGDSFNLVIDFKNDSQYTAKSIKLTPVWENVPLVYERPVTFEYEKSLRPNGTATASFPLQTKEDAKNGVYAMNIKIEYKNSADENYSKTGIVYFRVTGEKVKSIVTVNQIETEPKNVVAGEPFTLHFTVNNMGEMPMHDTTIRLTGLSADGIMPVDGTDMVYVGKIAAKSSVTKTFAMVASDKLTKGNHALGTVIQYNDENQERMSEEKTLYLFGVINNQTEETEDSKEENTTMSKPKIMIESYTTNPSNIVAGDQIQFTFRFKNTSRETAIKNMKITISSEQGAFMIASGSNTFYVENLATQASLSKSIGLNVKQDLASKSYPLTLSFDYEDTKNNAYTATEIINIPVVEYSNLVINNAYAGEAFIGGQTNLSFDYINMGKAVASNLTASVEGDYEAVQEINYIGNLEAGNSDYYDIPVKPTKEGQNFGILVLTFEDSSGKKIEVKKDFIGMAMTEPTYEDMPGIVDDPGMPMQEDVVTYSTWQYIGAGVGSFLVGFLLAKIITTKIIRKKLEDEI